MIRAKSTYLALIAVLLSPMAANAVPITVNGIEYDIYGLSTSYAENSALFESQAWWGDSDLARAFALAVSATAGAGSNWDVWGPYFAYEHILNDGSEDWRDWNWVNAWTNNPGGGADHNEPGDPWRYTYAFAEARSVPEPGTLALFGIGLFGIGLARRRQKV